MSDDEWKELATQPKAVNKKANSFLYLHAKGIL